MKCIYCGRPGGPGRCANCGAPPNEPDRDDGGPVHMNTRHGELRVDWESRTLHADERPTFIAPPVDPERERAALEEEERQARQREKWLWWLILATVLGCANPLILQWIGGLW